MNGCDSRKRAISRNVRPRCTTAFLVHEDLSVLRFKGRDQLLPGRIELFGQEVHDRLAYRRGSGLWLGMYRRLPGFAPLAEWAYRRVASNRTLLLRLSRWLGLGERRQ